MAMLSAAVMLIATAWMGDDAFITLRVIDNFVNGFGLRYNVIERVQVFTHPLWLLFLTPFYVLTREAVVTTMIVSMLLSLGALWVMAARVTSHFTWGCFLALVAVLSRTLCHYSTSGLENPLTFLLLALFVWQLYRAEKIWVPAGIAGMLLLNRLDLAVLLGPALAFLLLRARGAERVKVAAAAILPASAWMIFSLMYYGAPFPNTAYAKMGTGINTGVLIRQGLEYTKDFVRTDPLLALIIGKVVFDAARSRNWTTILLGVGIALYVAYTITIGGDFMSMRFFAAPGFLALCLLARAPAPHWWIHRGKAISLIAIAAFSVLLVSRIAEQQNLIVPGNGIADEQQFFHADNGLLPVLKSWMNPEVDSVHPWRRHAELPVDAGKLVVRESGAAGAPGYYGGPAVHIVDVFALTDAFLARLPSLPGSRTGHYLRELPAGYTQTATDAFPRTDIEVLRPLLNDVTLVTRGSLFAEGRWHAIWRLLSGRYNWLHKVYISGATLYGQLSQRLYEDAEKTANDIVDAEARNIAVKLIQADRAVHDSVSTGKPREAESLLLDLGSVLDQMPVAQDKWNPTMSGIVYASLNTLVTEWGFLAEHFPDNESVRYNAGLYLLSVGKQEYAVDHLRAAIESRRLPETMRGTALQNLGIALMNSRHVAEAETPLREALEQPYPDMQAYCLLSEVYKQTKRFEEAARAQTECRKQAPIDGVPQ